MPGSQNYEGPLLEVDALHVEFPTSRGVSKPVNGVSWSVEKGESLVILGESGSGKSISVKAVSGILPGAGRVVSGAVRLRGQSLLDNPKRHVAARGREIAMVFQDPINVLNPGFTVGRAMAELFRVHQGIGRTEAIKRGIKLLEMVQIPDPEDRIHRYPHELSGGMKQRISIALAISQEPAVLIADEPTTALDATVQLQVLKTLKELQQRLGMATVIITHDIGVASALADRIAVMYAGRIVEQGGVRELLKSPQHPYSRALLASVPRISAHAAKRLRPIPGSPPELDALPEGCAFHPRCQVASDMCRVTRPELKVSADRLVACHKAGMLENNMMEMGVSA